MKLAYPPRIDLARLPTPVQLLRRLGQQLGVELYIKRDDLTGAALSGNKIRKLEFVMAEALSQ
ncbi:MAG: D-cysteine desulfhydrase family protein, partial [Desulfobacterales bacterium]